MKIGYVKKEYVITDNESLILLKIFDDEKSLPKQYVCVVEHPLNKKLSFRSVEEVTKENGALIFASRSMFNGLYVDRLTQERHKTSINSDDLEMHLNLEN